MTGVTTKTLYAVAALYELGDIPEGEVLKIKEIAKRASIPQNFLEQILLELKKQGILMSIKGAHGGYRLAKPLKDILLKDVMMILESDVFSESCRTDNPALKLFWEDVRHDVERAFAVPLSELRTYRLKAAQAFNYSI